MSKTKTTVTEEKKIGVTKFLQLNPQPDYVVVLLKKKYAMELHTNSEWLVIVDNIVHKKIN